MSLPHLPAKAPACLALKIPPLLLLALCAAGIWFTPAWGHPPWLLAGRWAMVPALLLGLLGLATCLAGVAAFRRAQTTVNPCSPAQTTTLVAQGIYRYSRNPMYLGFALCLLALCLARGQMLGLLWWMGWIVYLQRYQIHPEEQALQAKFGSPYLHYCQQVRRWI